MGASYELKHCSTPNCKEKKHASNLSLYPLELIPFKPVDGSDTQYVQLHKPIQASPYKEARINGFKPLLQKFRLNHHDTRRDHPPF